MHFGFGRSRNVLLLDEGGEIIRPEEQESEDGTRKRHYPPLEMCLQLSMVCVSLVILFLGVAVTMIGFWAHQSQTEYLSITDYPPELTRLPLATLATGIVVALLGMIGLVGSIFSRTITGQTLLGSFVFALVLLIISELGAGAAAVTLRVDVEDVYIQSALRSQMMYGGDNETGEPSTASEWDKFQQKHQCCGAEGYVNNSSPYFAVFGNNSVPTSCCKDELEEDCETYAEDAIFFKEYLYQSSCPHAVIGIIKEHMLVAAVFAIVAGFCQLLAVVIAVCLLYTSSRLKQARERTYRYTKLPLKRSSQLETS